MVPQTDSLSITVHAMCSTWLGLSGVSPGLASPAAQAPLRRPKEVKIGGQVKLGRMLT